jgi:hypothetical protein
MGYQNARSLVRLFCLSALLGGAAHAQLVVGTGVLQSSGLDSRWQVSTNAGSSWAAASIVVSPPGQWTAGAPGGIWIGATPSGSGGGGSYSIRQQFSLIVGQTLSFNLRCAWDNSAAQMWINGSQVGTNACGTNIWSYGPLQTLTQSNFSTGLNTLEFRWVGDNTTDGMAVEVTNLVTNTNPSVVPEPSTYLLMATGLAGLTLVARKRRATL